LAPWDWDPEGPMLASRPALAIGDSEARNASTELDWARAFHERAKLAQMKTEVISIPIVALSTYGGAIADF